MTRLKTEKILFLVLALLLFSGAAYGKTRKSQSGPELYLTAGAVPIYYFSNKPDGGDKSSYHFSGSSVQGLFCYRTGKVSTRLGLAWNLLFLTGSDEKEVLNMLVPSLSFVYHLKKYYYGGMGMSGKLIPGTIKLKGNSFSTRFDLLFTLIAGVRYPVGKKLYLISELNYTLNVTHRQWSYGTSSGGTPFKAETKLGQMLVIYGGVSFPVTW